MKAPATLQPGPRFLPLCHNSEPPTEAEKQTMEEEQTTPAQAENTPAAPQPEGRAPERSSAPRVRKDDDDGGPRKMVTVGGGKDARGRSRRRRKVSFLTINKIYTIDYKDISLLRRFVNEQGKIVPSRQSG